MAELRASKHHYIHETGVYSDDWTAVLTGGRNSYEDYVNYIATPNSHGDSGCLEVFQRLHQDFGYVLWSPVEKSTTFTDRHRSMARYSK